MKSFATDSLYEIPAPSRPCLSPDGNLLAFVETLPDRKSNMNRTYLRLLDLTSGREGRITHTGKEGSLIWENGSTLLFPADREEQDKEPKDRRKAPRTVFYRLDPGFGEAQKAFSVDLDVTDLRHLDGLPGNRQYLLEADVDLNAPLRAGMEDKTVQTEEPDPKADDVHVLEELPFWHDGGTWCSRHRQTLYLFDSLDASLTPLTPPRFQVTCWDVRGPYVLYAGCAYDDLLPLTAEVHLLDIRNRSDLLLVPSGAYRVDDLLLAEHCAFLAMSDMKSYGSGQCPDLFRWDLQAPSPEKVCHMDGALGCQTLSDVAYGQDRIWRSVGDDLLFVRQLRSHTQVCRLRGSELTVLYDTPGMIRGLEADARTLIVNANLPDRGGELYQLQQNSLHALTHLQDSFVEDRRIVSPTPLPFCNRAGEELDGWVLIPEGAQEAAPASFPGILEIHGGPRAAYGAAFFHEMQLLCASGYFVFFCNPRGSEGYGEDFADLRGRYGTIDYEDLMDFTDAVLRACPALDPRRLGACGGSYGGFMCNWLETHTDRFAAIVSMRSIADWVSDFGTSEIGFAFDGEEMGATPYAHPEIMWAQSPLKDAARATTPILFLHSLCDYNCHFSQGLEMFTAMKMLGVPARMVLFEGESHGLSRCGKPLHRERRLKEMLDWFARYLRP